MRPIWKDNRLTVELHKRDEKVLRDARVIGKALAAMGQNTGDPLVEAVDAILGPSEGTLTPEQKLVKAIEEE